jgi:hypothetical protein
MKIYIKLGEKYLGTCDLDENTYSKLKRSKNSDLYIVKQYLDEIMKEVIELDKRDVLLDGTKVQHKFRNFIDNFHRITFETEDSNLCLNV